VALLWNGDNIVFVIVTGTFV